MTNDKANKSSLTKKVNYMKAMAKYNETKRKARPLPLPPSGLLPPTESSKGAKAKHTS